MWIHPKSKESLLKSNYQTPKPLFDQVIEIYCGNGPLSEQNWNIFEIFLKDIIKDRAESCFEKISTLCQKINAFKKLFSIFLFRKAKFVLQILSFFTIKSKDSLIKVILR